MKIALHEIRVDLPAQGGTLFRLRRFVVPAGQKVLLKGQSGAGKTTLLHLIAGLFHPAEGEVQVGEHRLNTMNDEERGRFRRQNVGLIFQKLNLIEHLTAIENVTLSLSGDVNAESKARAALQAVGLSEHGDRRSSVLSLGEQQRVAVARVLAADAKIILADEPTSSLDENNAKNVVELLLRAATGKTLLVVSHDHRIEKHFGELVNFADVVLR